eukprot:TRINITY_DN9784_c0_g1_i1.p1 TRINITY_DN9784_c0_g1~~TRINITY_DN9784_c0_g1_i1.p1  ORF type:complete len:263 (+),score=46.62 TRINITY_DN9784_c0_g1_i1:102-890(+)
MESFSPKPPGIGRSGPSHRWERVAIEERKAKGAVVGLQKLEFKSSKVHVGRPDVEVILGGCNIKTLSRVTRLGPPSVVGQKKEILQYIEAAVYAASCAVSVVAKSMYVWQFSMFEDEATCVEEPLPLPVLHSRQAESVLTVVATSVVSILCISSSSLPPRTRISPAPLSEKLHFTPSPLLTVVSLGIDSSSEEDEEEGEEEDAVPVPLPFLLAKPSTPQWKLSQNPMCGEFASMATPVQEIDPMWQRNGPPRMSQPTIQMHG